jgi:hypothetical protein
VFAQQIGLPAGRGKKTIHTTCCHKTPCNTGDNTKKYLQMPETERLEADALHGNGRTHPVERATLQIQGGHVTMPR